MFTKKIAVCYITKTNMWVAQQEVTSFERPISWETQELQNIFQRVKKESAIEAVSFLFADELSYLFALTVDQSQLHTEYIVNQASANVPTKVTDGTVAWKEMGTRPTEPRFIVQVAAIEWEYGQALAQAVTTAGMAIETCSVVGVVIAQALKQQPRTCLYLRDREERLALICHQGVVHYSGKWTETNLKIMLEKAAAISPNAQPEVIVDMSDTGKISEFLPQVPLSATEIHPLESFLEHDYVTNAVTIPLHRLQQKAVLIDTKIEAETIHQSNNLTVPKKKNTITHHSGFLLIGIGIGMIGIGAIIYLLLQQ